MSPPRDGGGQGGRAPNEADADKPPPPATDSGDAQPADGDAPPPPVTDGGDDAGKMPCDPKAPFGEAQPLKGLNTGGKEDGIWAMADDLTFYFSTAGERPTVGNSYDVFKAVRKDRNSSEFSIELLPGPINTVDGEQSPALTPDGKTIFYYSVDDIYRASRDSIDSEFSAGTPVAEVNSSREEADPFWAARSNRLYFASRRTGTWDIFVWSEGSEAEPLDSINTDDHHEYTPVLSEDELTIYYALSTGLDDKVMHIAISRRPSTTAPFEAPTLVAELTSDFAAYPESLSPDGCTLYFVSNRLGSNDFFSATRGGASR